MYDTSNVANYSSVIAGQYQGEVKVVIDDVEYTEAELYSVKTVIQAFDGENPSIGQAMVGKIQIVMAYPGYEIAKRAKIEPYVRIYCDSETSPNAAIAGYAVAGNAVVGTHSEKVYSGWIPKGVYYISSRTLNENSGKLTILGYDDMRKADVTYPSSTLEWSTSGPTAYEVLNEIATFLNVELDSRTITAIPSGTSYVVSFPAQYTIRDVLGSIAAMYGGNFCMSCEGKLMYVGLTDIPAETYYLADELGNYLTFGGTRILLQAG